jgi:hypothetical protein
VSGNIPTVPEAGTSALMRADLGALGIALRRRRGA